MTEIIEQPQEHSPESASVTKEENPRRRGLTILFILIILLAVIWIIVRPGVFTVQPIGAIPEGLTIIYHSRGPNMSFFSSPDGICLEIQGSGSLLCRGAALSGATDIIDREIIRLPYIHWAYLRSTGGLEFDR